MTEGNEEFDWSQFDGLGEGPHDPAPDGVLLINDMQLRKRLVWDIAPCWTATETAERLHLPSASPDVEDMEHRQAHERLEALISLLPVVQALTANTAEVVVGAMVTAQGLPMEHEEITEHAEGLAGILYMGVMGIIAEMVDLGFLGITPGKIEVRDGTSDGNMD